MSSIYHYACVETTIVTEKGDEKRVDEKRIEWRWEENRIWEREREGEDFFIDSCSMPAGSFSALIYTQEVVITYNCLLTE